VFASDVLDQVRATGLSDRVTFTGECDEDTVDGLYDASSVFVLPSHFETYGMVLTEAMARGLPIVTTTGGAIPSTVPSEVGVMVPPGDHVALACALRDLLTAPGDTAPARRSREELAAAALRHALTLPTWDDATSAFAEAVGSLTTPTRTITLTDDGRRGDIQPRLA